jgi:hypothetical protein
MQIYDVTKYLEDHPGGADVLLEATGTTARPEPLLDHVGFSFLYGLYGLFDSVSLFLKVRMLRMNLTTRGTVRVPRS